MTVVALTTAVAGSPGLRSSSSAASARHQRDDPVRAAGHVDLRHDAVALDLEHDALQPVARARAVRRAAGAQQRRELVGAQEALWPRRSNDAAVALPAAQRVDADAQGLCRGTDPDQVIHDAARSVLPYALIRQSSRDECLDLRPVQRSRHGRTGEPTPTTPAPRPAAPSSARSASPPCPRATISPSCTSCCAPPASRSWARRSSTARTRIPNTYLGAGKLEEVKEELKKADANVVACDDELSPRQERNLEQALGVPVVDRTAIILDIFAGHANSSEGKLQVELAQLEYNLARMRGLWTHLERLGGGIGTRGPGESQIETDRRLARDRISGLKRRLEHVQGARAVYARRARARALPLVALAGYTNAGKSTLLNRDDGRRGRRARPAVPHAGSRRRARCASTAGRTC